MRTQISFAWAVLAITFSGAASGQACYASSIMAPAPFLGNHEEVFKLADGSFWQVQYEYSYLYAYYPAVIVCPGAGKLSIDGKTLNVRKMSGERAAPGNSNGQRKSSPAPIQGVTIVYTKSGCDYKIADGPSGYYLVEWYGGYDADDGDVILGDLRGYGFKDVMYGNGQSGRIYVDDYALSKDSVVEKYREKCR
jgi:hypothetical protein